MEDAKPLFTEYYEFQDQDEKIWIALLRTSKEENQRNFQRKSFYFSKLASITFVT